MRTADKYQILQDLSRFVSLIKASLLKYMVLHLGKSMRSNTPLASSLIDSHKIHRLPFFRPKSRLSGNVTDNIAYNKDHIIVNQKKLRI
jgi:hypothetical protein